MALPGGIIAAIVVASVVFAVCIFLGIYCVWRWVCRKECCACLEEEKPESEEPVGSVVIVAPNLYGNSQPSVPGKRASSSSVRRTSRGRSEDSSSSFRGNTYLTPAASAVMMQSRSMSHDPAFGGAPLYGGGGGSGDPFPMSGATSLRASTARSDASHHPNNNNNNNSLVTFIGDDDEYEAPGPQKRSKKTNFAATAASSALQMPKNNPTDHVPMARRRADGAHLYYIFPDGDEDPDLAPAAKNNSSGRSPSAKKKKSSSSGNKNVVMELDLVEVGLGSENNKYVSFAMLSELAARHLPMSFEWEEGKEPPMCLAGIDEGEEADTSVQEQLVVLDLEKLVGNAESISETATWPLSLFIVERKVKPGQPPARISVLEHQIKKAALKQQQQQQQQQKDISASPAAAAAAAAAAGDTSGFANIAEIPAIDNQQQNSLTINYSRAYERKPALLFFEFGVLSLGLYFFFERVCCSSQKMD